MKSLLAVTEDFIKQERGLLSGDIGAGANVTIPVESAEGVSANDYVVIGSEGNELAELCFVSSVGTSAITVATLKFNHKNGEPFVVFRYNQRKFYGSTSAAGSYDELAGDGSPKDISVDDPQGTLLEYSGNTYTFFKSTYYNSTTNEETDIAESDAVSGDESKRYCSIYAIRKQAGLTRNPRISDGRIETKRKQAEGEINGALFARYILPLPMVPAIVSQICEMLGAGYIEYEEFGADGDGGKKLGEARANLKKIIDGTQRLLDADFIELPRNTKTGVLDGYPNAVDTDPAVFSMGDKY